MGFGLGGDGDDEVETMDPSQAYAAIARADERISELRAEPEKIRIWRENHNQMLEEKGNFICISNRSNFFVQYFLNDHLFVYITSQSNTLHYQFTSI